jgi:hypothetical protein
MAFEPTREGQLTEEKLNWGYWWVTHKVRVRRAFTVFMALLAAALVGYAGFGFLDWFFGSGVRERAQIGLLTQEVTDFNAFRQGLAPEPLVIDDANLLDANENTYDFIAQVSNENLRWWAEVDYRFLAAGAETRPTTAYILPGETKYLRALGVKSETRPAGPQIEVSAVRWKRVDQHAVRPDYKTWAGARLEFAIDDVKFTPPSPNDPISVSRATFTVTNRTAYSYWSAGFFVTLFTGSRIAGVNYVTISELRAGRSVPVDASWFIDLPSVSRVEVIPEVNIFDDRVYIPPGR